MSLVCFGIGEAALNHTVALTHSLHQENYRNWKCIGWLRKIKYLLQVYYVAKQCSDRCSAEEYAIALARHFVKTYPLVSHKLDIVPCSMPSSQQAFKFQPNLTQNSQVSLKRQTFYVWYVQVPKMSWSCREYSTMSSVLDESIPTLRLSMHIEAPHILPNQLMYTTMIMPNC